MQVGTAGLQPGHCTGKFGLNMIPRSIEGPEHRGSGVRERPMWRVCFGLYSSSVVCSLLSGSWPEESQR